MIGGHKVSTYNLYHNVRLLPFLSYLPYGICSKYATNISGNDNPYACMLSLGNDPDATIQAAESYRKNMLDRSRYMCDKGLVTEQVRPCGTPTKDYIFRCLTKEGLAILTDFPASIPEHMLLDYISATVIDGQLSPLATGYEQAKTIRITTSKLSQNQLYTIWRQSHIQAMFLANGYLTCLDRKPYGSGIVLGPIYDEASYERYLKQHGNTLLGYTYRTLADLYTNNPDLYMITQHYPDDGYQTYDDWLHTPALYLRNELPDVPPDSSSGQSTRLHGSKQAMYRTDLGVAMGRHVNFACYHTHPSTFRWNKKCERATKIALDQAIRFMKTQSPHLPYNPAVDFALFFCPTRHQFFNIFKSSLDRHKAGKSTPCPIDGPYASTHIIPINDTGSYMLRRFLKDSPDAMRLGCANDLLEADDRFNFSMNPTYPLTFKGRRVFLGYGMDIKRIHTALIDHLNGQDFYICCFPEQVAWYKKLFPDNIYL